MDCNKPTNYAFKERCCDIQNIRDILEFRTGMIIADINSLSNKTLSAKLRRAVNIFKENYTLESDDLSDVYESVEKFGIYENKLIKLISASKFLDPYDVNYEKQKKDFSDEIDVELNNIIFLQRWMGDGVRFIHILQNIVNQRLEQEYGLFSFQDRGTSFFSVDDIYNVLDYISKSYFSSFKNYDVREAISVLGEESLKIMSYGPPNNISIITQMPFHFIYRTRYWGLLAHEAANVFFRHWDSFDSSSEFVNSYIRPNPTMAPKLQILEIINEISSEQDQIHTRLITEFFDRLICRVTSKTEDFCNS